MILQERINVFIELGNFLSQFSIKKIEKKQHVLHNELFYEDFIQKIKQAHDCNGWFTENNVLYAIESWSKLLTSSIIKKWVEKYNFNISKPKKVAIIMAGNIPLVGFHDFLSVLITGHNVVVKQSSNDKILLPFIAKYLQHIESRLIDKIEFTDSKLANFNAVIATGSNNTARYFEYYFKGKPSIIRRNRNSVAVLNGKESELELRLLSEDIFRYYGLGCRNVSKLFVPTNYNFDAMFEALYHWHPIIHENKYANNYDYNKAVYLMSEFKFLDNGFMMLKEDLSYSSPIATLFYENYDKIEHLNNKLVEDNDKIQCVVSNGLVDDSVAFGDTQHPELWHYADQIDTVDFLLKI